jgi:hypothetical protein
MALWLLENPCVLCMLSERLGAHIVDWQRHETVAENEQRSPHHQRLVHR